MEHHVVRDPSMPQAMGHYSPVVRAGDLLFVAGQPGIDLSPGVDRASAQAVPGDFEAEARQAFANLEAVLKAAGSGLEHVVKITTFVAGSPEEGRTVGTLMAEYFPIDPPAQSAPYVARLPRSLRVSIEAIAVVP
jgi:2-iminobutanoate/2-iminopropanoate deaminase